MLTVAVPGMSAPCMRASYAGFSLRAAPAAGAAVCTGAQTLAVSFHFLQRFAAATLFDLIQINHPPLQSPRDSSDAIAGRPMTIKD